MDFLAKKKKSSNTSEKGEPSTCTSTSQTTIYHEAVLPASDEVDREIPLIENNDSQDPEIIFNVKQPNRQQLNEPSELVPEPLRRDSSSSEDRNDTSDEMLDVDKFIADCRESVRRRSNQMDDARPDRPPPEQLRQPSQEVYQGVEMIRENEANKARMMATPGNLQSDNQWWNQHLANVVDDKFLIVGNNVDPSVKAKILNHEYVDFARLLPKDRLAVEEDNRMKLVSRGGSTFFVPVVDHEMHGNGVNNFNKWEQAFRVFSNIYIQAYPMRAIELIQYNHLIFTATQSFIWENVYRYDKEFRIHMSHYPQRNWGIILQQAWSVYLKDRLNHKTEGHSPKVSSGKKKEACKRFNKGKCTNGFRCDYDHRCLICGKFGHGAHICRNKPESTAKLTNPEHK